MSVPAVNFHLYAPCNLRCRFCFATFEEVPGQIGLDDQLRLLDALRASGVKKLNFAGGEPTLYRHFGAVLRHAREVGFTTSIVTNGARLARVLDEQAGDLDWVGLSVDSADEGIQAALGRGRGDHVRRSLVLFDQARRHAVRVKLNTVVTRLNWQEDMAAFVRRVRPERWKVFQVLPMGGQNDEKVGPLLISDAEFRSYLERHAGLAAEGMAPVAEDNDAMRGSYVMVDPLGRFFGNATGRHVYSRPILEAGVHAALSEVGFSTDKFEARGGRYAW